jgi:hypothetical protein
MQTGDVPVNPDAPRGGRRVLRPGARPSAAPAAPEPAGDADGRLLRPAAACPRCGARPALRVTAAMVHALAGQAAHVRVGTYQCQRRGCGAIYDISVSAYQRAS